MLVSYVNNVIKSSTVFQIKFIKKIPLYSVDASLWFVESSLWIDSRLLISLIVAIYLFLIVTWAVNEQILLNFLYILQSIFIFLNLSKSLELFQTKPVYILNNSNLADIFGFVRIRMGFYRKFYIIILSYC